MELLYTLNGQHKAWLKLAMHQSKYVAESVSNRIRQPTEMILTGPLLGHTSTVYTGL